MKNIALVVRVATAEELPAIASLSYCMFEEMGAVDYLARLPVDWQERFVTTYTVGMVVGSVRHQVVQAQERIVASCGATIRCNKISGELVGRIFDVSVEVEHRGGGVATTLVERSLAWLRGCGCARITLRASDAGRSIYQRLGFTDVAEMELRP